MAKVVRLRTQRERQERAQLGRAADLLRDLPEDVVARLPARDRAAICTARKALRKQADAEESIWPDGGFNMVGRVKLMDVCRKIRALPPSARPVQVRDVVFLIIASVERNAPILPYTRQELADEIGCDPREITKIMRTLEGLGVLTRERRPEPGYRGLGRAVYVVNVDVAWNGDLEFRRQLSAKQRQEQAEKARAKLRVVPSSKAAE